jgi:putative acetyltransferase
MMEESEMNVQIRSERIQDYAAIAEVHAAAFTYNFAMGETALVDVHRHRSAFDPDLSLVAEHDERVIGHVLLSPHTIRVSGESVQGAILSPIAVLPEYQKSGIGGMLIREVHSRAAEKGIQFVLLLGHSTYYPRFGYRTNMFGTCHIRIQRTAVPEVHAEFSMRRITHEDVPMLMNLWHEWFDDVDLAIQPEASLTSWLSPDKHLDSGVVYAGEEWLGHVRYPKYQPDQVRLFLSPNRESATRLLSFINQKIQPDVEYLTLPIHPERRAANNFISLPFESEMKTWNAAMIKVLNPENRVVLRYCDEVYAGTRAPGLVVWPVEFDVC